LDFCDVILVTFFDVVIVITPLNNVITDYFKVRFRHNRFEKPQFGQIT